MRPFREGRWACALLLLGVGAVPVQAAWYNVFQVCCASCQNGSVAVSGYAGNGCCPPACCPQQTVCTTQYVQRCYYQPVTCYQTKTYYEAVTTYRTSYYCEPVCTYRYSCYFDPCTCSYQQVACPVTSYRLRAQCCPVTSWVQRCCQVPVTTYRQCSYWEPVTTCYSVPACPAPCPPPCCVPACPTNGTAVCPAPAVPAVTEQAAPAPAVPAQPGVTEQRTYPAPAVQEQRNGYDRYYLAPPTQPPPAAGSSYRQLPPRVPAMPRPNTPAAPPAVRLDRIVALPAPAANVQGQVVRTDNSPRAGARLLFVRADQHGPQQTVTADASGQFRVTLASGGWLVYVHGTDGKPVFHSKIDVKDRDSRLITLVSR